MHLRSLALTTAALAILAPTACTLPSLGTGPSSVTELQIRGTTLLMVGGRGRLTAWEPKNGQMREVRATWTVEGDAISLTSDGVVAARRLGHAIVRASAADVHGTATVHVVTDVSGTWRGSITIVDCWQSPATAPDPCAGRRQSTAPLVIDVTQSATADQFDNLRAAVSVFTPAATGNFVGALDSSGHFFLDGHVERPADGLFTAVRFRWQLEGDRLVPFSIDGQIQDRVDVQPSVRIGSSLAAFNEIWQPSTMTR